MKIVCYCQHVLGIGHFHRSLAICEELAHSHETVMILGGPEVSLPDSAVRFFTLPGLKMDAAFSKLLPCQPGADIEQIKEQRQQQLFSFLKELQPDIFLVELYPFGRKAFAFELDPVLTAIGNGELASCLRICSLRDILVEKTKKEKYEKRVLNSLNSSFDALLVHSDPDFIALQETFSRTNDIAIPLHYTGFISRSPHSSVSRQTTREKLQLATTDKLIVASIGGGSVGEELLLATVDAANHIHNSTLHFHLFSGPYSDPQLTKTLQAKNGINTTVHSFTDNFSDWLEAADLSISMAGYNTCMNVLRAGVPALLYPFAQNHEQAMRIAAFSHTSPLSPLQAEDLQGEKLARLIQEKLHMPRQSHTINLNGAQETARLLDSRSLWNRLKQ